MATDLGYACPACGSRDGFTAHEATWNCWQCVSCEMMSAIKNDCMELIGKTIIHKTPEDQQVVFTDTDKSGRDWAASNKAFCDWVHRRYEHKTS